MKVLVAIASYGKGNDRYLAQLVKEYQSMSFDMDIVVHSNIHKEVAPGVKLIVGMPGKNSCSLPFAHRSLFADRVNDYDLFIYTEDDVLITEKNVQSFLKVSASLHRGELAGFLRFERGPSGETNYPDVHAYFHWDGQSVVTRNQFTLAHFTNEHAGCYLLTREQLKAAIQSGGFSLREHHHGKYGMLEAAATDPYIQCGFKKLICISHLNDFLVHHLPNKYVKTTGIETLEFNRQIEALVDIGKKRAATFALFQTETKLKRIRHSKGFYEPVQEDVVSLIPSAARSVLSLGCGSGAIEEWLAKKGLHVIAVPLDSVIASCVEARGVETVHGDFKTVREKLNGQRFDCLLMPNVLHLVSDPSAVLSSFAGLLSEDSTVIALVPNLLRFSELRNRIRYDNDFSGLIKGFQDTGVHFTSHRVLHKWFKRAGFRIEQILDLFPKRSEALHQVTFGLLDSLLAEELLVVARRTGKKLSTDIPSAGSSSGTGSSGGGEKEQFANAGRDLTGIGANR